MWPCKEFCGRLEQLATLIIYWLQCFVISSVSICFLFITFTVRIILLFTIQLVSWGHWPVCLYQLQPQDLPLSGLDRSKVRGRRTCQPPDWQQVPPFLSGRTLRGLIFLDIAAICCSVDIANLLLSKIHLLRSPTKCKIPHIFQLRMIFY